ncbi:glutathionylspermidine synthase family protein [Bacillus cereus]|uniref:glutathionylspermidine synthase family protein n=1 Tax=Bacillus cereus group TaxID=86661 RepID=UPI0018A7AE32|nr:glutathionylspermidine synthase family protein [Bacillus cereus]MBF8118917.1 glutathionylspermidine synthase family protein [Bacillus cereus]
MLNEKQQMDYMKLWFDLSEKAAADGFTWPSLLENNEWNQYMAIGMYKMKKEQYDEIMQATKLVSIIFERIYQYIIEEKSAFLKLKFPIEAWEVARTNYNGMFSYFTRFDFIVNNNQIKVIEINADTPTGYLEPSVANKTLCSFHNTNHPNRIEEKLAKAWETIIKEYNIQANEVIHFTSYDWHEEDYQTVQFIRRHCKQPNEYIGVQDIVVADDGIYTPEGTRIDYLYRLYPLEYLLEDKDAYGKKIGLQFLDHIAQGRVKIINPPSAFLLQNKAVLALIWELHEKNIWFTEKEQEIIAKYFLPTYLSKEEMEKKYKEYVIKPRFGREGAAVSIVKNGNEVESDKTDYYIQQDKVYQIYFEMPDCTIDTWDGNYNGKLLIGSHLIGNEPAGLFLRIGERITGNLSMFMGVTIS